MQKEQRMYRKKEDEMAGDVLETRVFLEEEAFTLPGENA